MKNNNEKKMIVGYAKYEYTYTKSDKTKVKRII